MYIYITSYIYIYIYIYTKGAQHRPPNLRCVSLGCLTGPGLVPQCLPTRPAPLECPVWRCNVKRGANVSTCL